MFRAPRATLAAVVALTALISACTPSSADRSATGGDPADQATGSTSPATPRARMTMNVDRHDVTVDSMLALTATNGTLTDVEVTSPEGPVEGTTADDGSGWQATGRLEPGTRYRVSATLVELSGETRQVRRSFSTEDLTLDEQTYPSIAPLDGETVGIGMPVIVTFDIPVTDRASIERHLHVTSTPRQAGSWRWISNREVHWRPARYWQAGSKVHVDLDINSISAGNGIYGQLSRTIDFTIGDANVYKVNTVTDQMRVFSNGELLRTIPVTTGKPGFTTRSGVKVIIEKFESRHMRSETVGIPADSAEGYDLSDVQWAMRITFSGEFIHAAPWSVPYQGYSNVSHGCTGMSTSNADWLFHMTLRGDVVVTKGTDRMMTLTNGWGDWNLKFADYRKGSALN